MKFPAPSEETRQFEDKNVRNWLYFPLNSTDIYFNLSFLACTNVREEVLHGVRCKLVFQNEFHGILYP